jgi:hypothetical protein
MTFTVDRPVDDAVALREVGGALIDPHQTGYLVTTFTDLSIQSITSDDPDKALMRASHQVTGSFVPAMVSAPETCLANLLSCDWLLSALADDEGEDDLMVLPPPYLQRMTLRVRNVFYGVPSPIAFED